MAQIQTPDGEIARGDEARIRAICNHLLTAFAEFCNASPTPVDYVDTLRDGLEKRP